MLGPDAPRSGPSRRRCQRLGGFRGLFRGLDRFGNLYFIDEYNGGSVYKFVPTTSLGWRTAIVAAVFASIGFEAVKYGLGVYLTEFADFTRVSSAFATLILVVVSFGFLIPLRIPAYFVLGAWFVLQFWAAARAGSGGGGRGRIANACRSV
ncbi:MAG: YihY/virulence factor BrkB family protein, partial [Chloroflexi bacterium]|nr:YihY/virulence factor BrkB family protein [Chloroflexota bacterium]